MVDGKVLVMGKHLIKQFDASYEEIDISLTNKRDKYITILLSFNDEDQVIILYTKTIDLS